ncbi:MAG: DedA family protein [Deltaproteobacteria bacterium]|nr:DedA family protein [Deltaproteobacteria bacterium]
MLNDIAEAITGFVSHNNNPLGLLLLGLSALVEYVFPPFPGDTVTLFGAFLVVRHGWSMPWVYASVMVGSGVGALLDYGIGVWISRRYVEGRIFKGEAVRRRINQVLLAFERHGALYIVLNRFLPAARAVIFIAAGMSRLKVGWVLFYSLLSAAAWNALILGAGYAVGANWDRLKLLFQRYALIAWGALGVGVAVFLVLRWRARRRAARTSGPTDEPPR